MRKVVTVLGILFILSGISSVWRPSGSPVAPDWPTGILGCLVGAAMLYLAYLSSEKERLKEYEYEQSAEKVMLAFNEAKKEGGYKLDDAAEDVIAKAIDAHRSRHSDTFKKLFAFCVNNSWYVYTGHCYSSGKEMSDIILEEMDKIAKRRSGN